MTASRDSDCLLRNMRRHVWVAVASIIALSITFVVTVVFAQEPHTTVGLPGPSLLDAWMQPSAIGMIAAVFALIITLRENVKEIKTQLAEIKANVAKAHEAIEEKCVSRREWEDFRKDRGRHS